MKNIEKEPQSIAHERPIWRQPGAPTLPLKERPEPRQLVRQKAEAKGGPKREQKEPPQPSLWRTGDLGVKMVTGKRS